MIQAYNYLLGNYPLKREVLYPAKNRGELKRVYNNIVNLSKRSPFYKIDISQENQEYTIGIKEKALEIGEKLKNMQESEDTGFHSKTVSVSDKNVIDANLLKDNTDLLPDIIKIKVNSLAMPQINRGKELMNTSFALRAGRYKLLLNIKDETYPMTFVHEEKMSNQDTLKKMADFINQTGLGINALVEKGKSSDYSQLVIVSDLSGRFGDKKFSFEDEEEDLFGEGLVDFFGMNRIEQVPSYSNFELNGVEKQTATNSFALENTLQIELINRSDNPVTLRIVPDSNKILSSVESVISTYNQIITLANERTHNNKEHYGASKLIGEMKSLVNIYKEELTATGIKEQEDGTLKIDDSLAVGACEDGGMESLFTRKNGFIARMIDKSESIAINPMEYLDKTIVLYPNTDKISYSNPYVTSMYSGLFFSSYC